MLGLRLEVALEMELGLENNPFFNVKTNILHPFFENNLQFYEAKIIDNT